VARAHPTNSIELKHYRNRNFFRSDNIFDAPKLIRASALVVQDCFAGEISPNTGFLKTAFALIQVKPPSVRCRRLAAKG
jgi:hypothetical protein